MICPEKKGINMYDAKTRQHSHRPSGKIKFQLMDF
jgi:hypothetical protein